MVERCILTSTALVGILEVVKELVATGVVEQCFAVVAMVVVLNVDVLLVVVTVNMYCLKKFCDFVK